MSKKPLTVISVTDKKSAGLYRKPLYTRPSMPQEKTVSVSFRVSPRFKQLLESAAALERRSQTNMLEVLLFTHCEQHNIAWAIEPPKDRKVS